MVVLAVGLSQMAKQQRNDEAVRLGADVVRQARIVSAARGITLGQYLTDSLRDRVAADYRKLAESMAEEVKPTKSPKLTK